MKSGWLSGEHLRVWDLQCFRCGRVTKQQRVFWFTDFKGRMRISFTCGSCQKCNTPTIDEVVQLMHESWVIDGKATG